MDLELQAKYDGLASILRTLGSVAVAYSGGVDSTLLLRVAHDVLGKKAVAFTAATPFVPERDVHEAEAYARVLGAEHKVVKFPILDVPNVRENPKDRCYYCKYAIFKHMKGLAAEHGLKYVIDGTNRDDDADFRPGRRALEELAVVSPLYDAGFTKSDIRALAKALGVPNYDKPSFACLASRFAYGENLDGDKLSRVNTAEEFLMQRGFRQLRVRVRGNDARIELMPIDLPRMLDSKLRKETDTKLRELGFAHVSLDLLGYRSGSMNEG